MDKVNFILGVHNHQPIGNFDFVFEKAYTQAYHPFLEAMERHSRLHWNLHAPGILWEWLEDHHPEYVKRVAEQVRQGRLEILTGGYYEPILPSLPDADKVGQIQKLTDYLRQRFKTTPTGLWLTERVWEPTLPPVLREAGVAYTLVDDAHFLMTGMTDDQMCGPYITEDQGVPLTLLPILKALRYAIPFKDPGETLNILRRFASPEGNRALVMFDDGEKFGLWPETYDHVYTNGWLERFLTVLESNADWIHCSRLSDYVSRTPPFGRVYLPTGSYYEMSEWTLPPASQETLSDVLKTIPNPEKRERAQAFLHGGFWRNFLTRYEESNTIHKKMLRVSQKIRAAAGHSKSAARKASARIQKMLDALWAGQCNCAYWHGVFGGLYLPHLRQALYRQLLRAENLAEAGRHSSSVTVVQEDFDRDGSDEILVESPRQNLYFTPRLGGALFEWDLRANGINLLNVLTRRPEAYHRQLQELHTRTSAADSAGGIKTIHERVRVKEVGLERHLHTDWYRRMCLLDHFLHPNTSLDDFYRCRYGEQGDFINNPYQAEILGGASPRIHLSRAGTVWNGDQPSSIRLEKNIQLLSSLGWQVSYHIRNEGPAPCCFWFGSEMAFAFSSQDQPEPVERLQQSHWQRRDHGFGIRLHLFFETPMDLWEFPLETVSLSEEGFERTYQGTVLLAHRKVELAPGQILQPSWKVQVSTP